MLKFLSFLIIIFVYNFLSIAMENKPFHHLPDGTFRNPEGSPQRDPSFNWSFKIFNKEKRKLNMDIPANHVINKKEVLENLKKKGLEITATNIAKTWFIKGEAAKYFDICIEAGKQTSMKTADNSLIALKNWNGVDTLKDIKNETLIIWGDQDKSYNLEQIQTLEHNIENSKLIIFKNCAHNVHLEQPDQFNKTIKDFLL